MIRSPAFLRRMTCLAFAATLLLAFAPAVSRVLAERDATPVRTLVELCTSAGLQLVEVIQAFAGPAAQGHADAPAAPHHAAGEAACDYCALAASLPLLLLFLCALAPILVHAQRLPSTPRLRVLANLRGLGSQGPPILL